MNNNDQVVEPMFANKVVVVTGGSSGIGKQVARDLLSRGSRVIICSNVPETLAQAQCQLRLASPEIDARVCDVRDTEQVRRLANHVLARYGQIDILINNAGYAVYRPFEESSLEEVLDMLMSICVARCAVPKPFCPA
jgi:NAD(P)-dependent dehydrogenase (short-subunit alcohol dehydrogenase family)